MSPLPEMLNRVTPWSAALALEFLEVSGEKAVMRLPWREDLAAFEDARLLASGAIATLVDQACGMAVMARFDRPVVISTLNLKIDHVRPAAMASSVTVEARCYHLTRNIAFVRADVWDSGPGALVAAAQGSFAFRRNPAS